jgi:hypothetical protein
LSEYNQEDDEGRDPAPELVGMHDLVAKKRNQKSHKRENEDPSESRKIVVGGIQQLGAENCVHAQPAYTLNDIEKNDCNCCQ